MLIPLALINVAIVAAEVLRLALLGRLRTGSSPPTSSINLVLTVFFIGMFFRIIRPASTSMPRRVRLVGDIGVPSLPAPGRPALMGADVCVYAMRVGV